MSWSLLYAVTLKALWKRTKVMDTARRRVGSLPPCLLLKRQALLRQICSPILYTQSLPVRTSTRLDHLPIRKGLTLFKSSSSYFQTCFRPSIFQYFNHSGPNLLHIENTTETVKLDRIDERYHCSCLCHIRSYK
jgi:hypothetical protein